LGRIIGIDLGLKRTGLAVTDPDQMIATPLDALETVHLMEYLKKYCSEEDVDGFALGDPVKPDGSPTHTTKAVKQMAVRLKKIFPDKEVFLIDERYTSSLAMDAMVKGGTSKKYRRDKGNIDKISATIILQSYLERKSYR
jgi:putative Holliday junction resolvase